MKDGIIQKIFKDYLNQLDNIPWDKKDLNELEQELIQAIKAHTFDSDAYFNDTIKEQLIGDNQ